MRGQQLRRALLIFPGETAGAIGCELHVVRWICIDEVIFFERQGFEIAASELPARKEFLVLVEIRHVVDLLVGPEGHIEFAALIESAKSIEASAIQKVKELGSWLSVNFALFDHSIESVPVRVEELFIVSHLNRDRKPPLNLRIKVY